MNIFKNIIETIREWFKDIIKQLKYPLMTIEQINNMFRVKVGTRWCRAPSNPWDRASIVEVVDIHEGSDRYMDGFVRYKYIEPHSSDTPLVMQIRFFVTIFDEPHQDNVY